jgi:hypothetical protein
VNPLAFRATRSEGHESTLSFLPNAPTFTHETILPAVCLPTFYAGFKAHLLLATDALLYLDSLSSDLLSSSFMDLHIAIWRSHHHILSVLTQTEPDILTP